MSKLGRNKPCYCGSGKKYKKCCLAKDEEERRLEQKEEQYEEDPSEEIEDDPVEEYGEEYDGYQLEDSEDVPDISPLPAEDAPELNIVEDNELSPEEVVLCEEWGTEYVKISDPDKLRTHIEKFMDLHPDLIGEIELGGEPLLELGDMYVRQGGRHQAYIDMLNRLRIEFPDEYLKSFPYFDNDVISWLIINNQKDKIQEFLNNYRQYPAKDADNLFELIYFLMSWNCQDILTDFLPNICNEVCSSPNIIGGNEIIPLVITTIMAPYLEQGLEKMDFGKLADEIKTLEDLVNPDWTNPKFLKERIEIILGKHEHWNIDDCRTRKQAIERYYDMTTNFMGWLVNNTGLDCCAAKYHSGLVFEYLAEALPKKKKKKHRTAFPFAEKNMDRLIARISQRLMWHDSTKLFGLLNGLYRFQEFLEETLSLAPEQAKENKESCVHLFEKSYPTMLKQDFKSLAWERFPREDMKLL